jgi:hypothetical protein
MVTRRHVEVVTGLALALIGAVTAYGARENGIGWTDFGPAAGYFPFRIGLLVLLFGLAIALRYGLTGRRRVRPVAEAEIAGPAAMHPASGLDERFLEDGALGRIASVFVPTAVAAALIPWLGVYFACGLFLVFSIVTLNKSSLAKALLIAVCTMAAFFVLFEFWFQVPLAKGVLMPLLGIH